MFSIHRAIILFWRYSSLLPAARTVNASVTDPCLPSGIPGGCEVGRRKSGGGRVSISQTQSIFNTVARREILDKNALTEEIPTRRRLAALLWHTVDWAVVVAPYSWLGGGGGPIQLPGRWRWPHTTEVSIQ